MNNIYYDGNLKASLTVGSVSDINPLNAYTKDQVDQLLGEKSDVNHTHEQYLTEHQDISHLATKEYVNEQLIDVLETKADVEHDHDNVYVSQSEYANLSSEVENNSEKINNNEISIINNTRKLNTLAAQKLDPDTSYDSLLTNDKTIIGAINEIFEMVRSLMPYTITVNYIDIDGNVLQDPYIFTVKPDEEYNVSEIKIDGYFYYYADKDLQGTVTEDTVINIVYIAIGEDGLPLPTSEFYVQYTIGNLIDPEELLSTMVVSSNGLEETNFYLPSLTNGYNDFTKKEILLKDGSITGDLDIMVKDIECIRLYYNPLETRLRFFGSSVRSHNIKKLEYINTKNFTDMNNMFGFCGNLVGIEGIEDWDTSNVTDMTAMFFDCNSLTSLDLSSFNTSNVTNMDLMFYSCGSLTSLDLSSFNTKGVNDMTSMFSHCPSLTKLDLSSFNTSNVTAKENMFLYVPSDVDFNYDGSNYQNWTLTESDTYFAGTFPWNKTIIYKIANDYVDNGYYMEVIDNNGDRIYYDIFSRTDEGENGIGLHVLEIPYDTKEFSINFPNCNKFYDRIIVDEENTTIYLDELTNAYYYKNHYSHFDLTNHPNVEYTLESKYEVPLDEKYTNPGTGYMGYYALPYIPDFESKLNSNEIIVEIILQDGRFYLLENTGRLSGFNTIEIRAIRIVDLQPGHGNLNGIRFGNSYDDNSFNIVSNIISLNVPEVDDYIFSYCGYLQQINLQSDGEYRCAPGGDFAGFGHCKSLKILNLGYDKVPFGSFKGTPQNLIVFGNPGTTGNIEYERENIAFQGTTVELLRHNNR